MITLKHNIIYEDHWLKIGRGSSILIDSVLISRTLCLYYNNDCGNKLFTCFAIMTADGKICQVNYECTNTKYQLAVIPFCATFNNHLRSSLCIMQAVIKLREIRGSSDTEFQAGRISGPDSTAIIDKSANTPLQSIHASRATRLNTTRHN